MSRASEKIGSVVSEKIGSIVENTTTYDLRACNVGLKNTVGWPIGSRVRVSIPETLV